MIFPNKNPGTRSPVTMMREVGEDNETFNRTLDRADTDGDRIPDRNLETVYDAFFDAAPAGAASMIHREDGEYRALRIRYPVEGNATEGEITREVRAAATHVDGDGLRATTTGGPVKNQAVAADLLDTVVEALAVTLLVVLVGLVAAYRRTEDDWTLGLVALAPVVLSLTWILGTMRLFGIPFNVMTALITSFTIGIGVDYSIHLTERYAQELERHADVSTALRTAVFGTGGALLGSAVTDVCGVGVLAFAILVPLQQFGVITAVTIAYSFLASVVVLPSLLVLWTRWRRPEVATGGE
jgi:predicted RND superfamily exporter protein